MLTQVGRSQIQDYTILDFDSLMRQSKSDTLKIEHAFNYALDQIQTDTIAYKKAFDFADRLLKQQPNYLYGYLLKQFDLLFYCRVYGNLEAGLPHADAIISKVIGVNEKRYDELKVKALINKGDILQYLSEADQAQKCYERAIDLANIHQLKSKVLIALTNMSSLFGSQENYQEQIRINRQILVMRLQPNESKSIDKDGCAFTYLAIADGFNKSENQMDSAATYLALAKALVFPEHNLEITNMYYSELSHYEMNIGNYQSAILNQRKVLAGLKQQSNTQKEIIVYTYLSNIYSTMDQPKKAIAALDTAAYLCKKIGDVNQLTAIYLGYYKLYKLVNNPDRSFFYLEKYYQFKDSLKIEAEDAIFKIQEKKLSEKLKDQELEHQKNLNTINSQSISQNKIVIGFLVGLLLFSILLFLFYFRTQKLIQQKNGQISELKLKSTEDRLNLEKYNAILISQEEERTRIAKDLHDEVGGALAALKFQIQNHFQDHSEAENTVEMVDHLAAEVRHLSHNMMPDAIQKFGFRKALIGYISKLNLQSKTIFKYQLDALEGLQLTEPKIVALYRVIQELLTNALKHAQAQTVYIQAYESDHNLSISIEDDGLGMDNQIKQSGIGIKNIKSRVDYLNGSVEFSSAKNKGTSIQISIPLNDKP